MTIFKRIIAWFKKPVKRIFEKLLENEKFRAFGRFLVRCKKYKDWGKSYLGGLDTVFGALGGFISYDISQSVVLGLITAGGIYALIKAGQVLGGLLEIKAGVLQYEAEYSQRVNPVQVRIHNALHPNNPLEMLGTESKPTKKKNNSTG